MARIRVKIGVETEGVAYGELEVEVPDELLENEEKLDEYLWTLNYEDEPEFEGVNWSHERAYVTGSVSSLDGWEIV